MSSPSVKVSHLVLVDLSNPNRLLVFLDTYLSLRQLELNSGHPQGRLEAFSLFCIAFDVIGVASAALEAKREKQRRIFIDFKSNSIHRSIRQ